MVTGWHTPAIRGWGHHVRPRDARDSSDHAIRRSTCISSVVGVQKQGWQPVVGRAQPSQPAPSRTPAASPATIARVRDDRHRDRAALLDQGPGRCEQHPVRSDLRDAQRVRGDRAGPRWPRLAVLGLDRRHRLGRRADAGARGWGGRDGPDGRRVLDLVRGPTSDCGARSDFDTWTEVALDQASRRRSRASTGGSGPATR